VSRTQAKLDALKDEIEATHGVQVRTVAADLTKLDTASLDVVAAAAEGLDVGILVNCAGMSYEYPEYLEMTSAAGNADLIAINAIAPTLIAQRVLLGMKERGRGAIVNIGSFNGALPAVPLLAAYAGSKAYVNAFTRALDAEARAFGVSVHDQCPMFVATKMSKIRRARLDAPTPAAWARAAVRQIGYDTILTPWWYHGLMNGVVALAPDWVIIKYIRDLHISFRTRWYKKQAREAAAAAGETMEAKKSR
jgi:17beta-estradiol 17-dehydrogenase / very-long-chain 3-oxoacyl-CoA reductase